MARLRAPERRRQLLEAASEVFARLGYRGATTAALARAAGVTEPILYRHFRNKHSLFVTLIEVVGEEVVDRWRSALERAEDPHDRLRALLAGNPATHLEGRGIYRIIFQAMTEVDGDDAIRRAIRKHIRTIHAFIADELTSLQDAGVVRADEPAERLAWMLVDVAVGFGMIAPLNLTGHTRRAGGERIQKLLDDLLNRDQ